MGCACSLRPQRHRERTESIHGLELEPSYNSTIVDGRLCVSEWFEQLDQAKPPNKPMATGIIFSGLFVIFIALQSPLDNLSEHMLSFHQLQHFMLRMLAPLLILLGAPLTPMLRGLPPWMLRGVVRPVVRNDLARAAYDKLTNPVISTLIFMGTLYLWQIPGGFNLALRNEFVHALMHMTMMSSGFIFYWAVIDPAPRRSRVHYGLRVLYLGLIVLPNTILGAVITFSKSLVYTGYADVYRPFDMSLMTDQQIGGLLLWVPGDMMSVLAAGIVMIMWYQREEAINHSVPPSPPRQRTNTDQSQNQ